MNTADNNLMTEHTFETTEDAREACSYLNRTPGNNGHTVAFRDGCRVYLRDGWTGRRLCVLLKELSEAY